MNKDLPASNVGVRPPRVYPALLLLVGLGLGWGGARLLLIGGSAYYLCAGAAIAASGICIWRRSRWGVRIYGLMLVVTLVWSLIEVGFDAWGLLPRMLALVVLGLWLVTPWMRRALGNETRTARLVRLPSVGSVVAIVLLFAGTIIVLMLTASGLPKPISAGPPMVRGPLDGVWHHTGRTLAGTRYSPLNEIAPSNVTDLQVAWTYKTDVEGGFQSTPLMVGDALYFCTPKPSGVTALDAETGQLRWRFDAPIDDQRATTRACRGVAYHRSSERRVDECSERILAVSSDAMLLALDARTGRPCNSFGEDGRVDLHDGLGEVKPGYYAVTSPPLVAGNLAVVGGFVSDNREVGEPSGVVRAFDVTTGRLAWAWDLGKQQSHQLRPGEIYTRSTPNAWGLFSYDEELGLIFVPTGNSTPDYFGAHRSEASEEYASSVVALDVATGQVRWSYQTTHHDLWDYDNAAQPVLIDLPVADGGTVPALIQPTKQGEIFMLDRRTGQPLSDVRERPVPQSAVSGDWTSPTQPFSVGMPSFAGDALTEADMWGLTPADQLWCRIAFRKARYEGAFTPPSLQGTLQYPGTAGGINWGSVSVDEHRLIMVVNTLHIANIVKLIPRDQVDDTVDHVQAGTPYGATARFFMSPLQIPCQRPPYGRVAAVDLRTRKLLWSRPIGTTNELGPLGMRLRIPVPMGVPLSAGSIVTESGLIFIGGTRDRFLRALDLHSGRELWRDYLPGTAQATPMTYVSPRSGRQFVAIAAGGKAPLIGGGDQPTEGQSSAKAYMVAYTIGAHAGARTAQNRFMSEVSKFLTTVRSKIERKRSKAPLATVRGYGPILALKPPPPT